MKISYWDSEKNEQCERDATPEEIAQAQADIEAARRPAVPDSVPMAEARKVMRKAGVLEPIRSLVRAAGADAEDDFEYQPRIRRQHPLVLAAIARGILTAEKADELFIDAAKLAGQAL